MKLLLVGSTGLVGRHVLDLALADKRVDAVFAPARRRLSDHRKLLAPIVDFEHLPEDADWWRTDAVICTLGTTMRMAGSKEAFRRVDHDYPLAVARLARSPRNANIRPKLGDGCEPVLARLLQPS